VIAAGAKKAKKAQTIRWNTNLLCQPRSHFEIRELPGCYSTGEFDFSVKFKLRCYLTVVTAGFWGLSSKGIIILHFDNPYNGFTYDVNTENI
jgi:hypothetical protein